MEAMTSWEEKGFKIGVEKARKTIALKLLQEGYTVELVTEVTSLTIAEVQQLQENNLA
jgi:predicted transposase YdaD